MEKKDLSKLYTDDTQEAIHSMQKSADEMTEKYHANPFSVRDVVLDIIMFFVCVAGAFGWMMLMLLIVSFISLSYLHFKFDKMVLASVIAAIVVAVVYIVLKARKYTRLNDEKRRRKEKKRAEQLSGDPDESFLFKERSAKNK